MNVNKRQFVTGAGLLGAAGMMAVPPTAFAQTGAKSQDVFNVRDFGAKGDGKTPDSEAVQKALDAAGAVGGTVFFPPGVYPCHDLKVKAHTALAAEAAWSYRGVHGAVLALDSEEASCVLDITGAFGVHLRGLCLTGKRGAKKKIHGVFLNNAAEYSKQEDTVVIDDCKIEHFSGHGVCLLRCWLFIIRHSMMGGNGGCGAQLTGWDGFVTDNQFSGNGGHGFGCEGVGATVMFTANRVEWNGGDGLHLCGGDAWNVTGNCFDRNGGAGFCALKTSAAAATGNVFRRCGKDAAKLKEGERSCQVRLEECSGLTFTGNACLAGRDDGGKGLFTPQAGFILRKLTCCVVADNVLHRGYMDELSVDLGGHGPDFVFERNVGTPMR
jgi:hypothetical protein